MEALAAWPAPTSASRVRTANAPTLAGTVEHREEMALLLRLDEPAPGLGLVYAYDWRARPRRSSTSTC